MYMFSYNIVYVYLSIVYKYIYIYIHIVFPTKMWIIDVICGDLPPKDDTHLVTCDYLSDDFEVGKRMETELLTGDIFQKQDGELMHHSQMGVTSHVFFSARDSQTFPN